ncbi:MAG TPA: permease-like cell division protein FtsX [Clostridia bacterium]|nr:permease-like cell division protein FtsX [Clostridia bacterium]
MKGKSGGSVGYLTKEGFRYVYVNKLMSIASISVLFSCLVMIGSAGLLLVNMYSMISNIEEKNVITVFYEDGVQGQPGDSLGSQIQALSNVKSAEFVPNEAAFQQQIAISSPEMKEYLAGKENSFPDAYKVTVKDMGLYTETVEQLQAISGVASVSSSSGTAKTLNSLRTTVTTISLGIIFMLLAVSLFIISNTIKITMFNRRLEISIMRSVGATNMFIRWPFMLEGMIIGVLAGILATLAVWGIYESAIRSLTDLLTNLGGSTSPPFSHYALLVLVSFVGIGIVIGSLGSTISIAKYLKEKEYVCHEV